MPPWSPPSYIFFTQKPPSGRARPHPLPPLGSPPGALSGFLGMKSLGRLLFLSLSFFFLRWRRQPHIYCLLPFSTLILVGQFGSELFPIPPILFSRFCFDRPRPQLYADLVSLFPPLSCRFVYPPVPSPSRIPFFFLFRCYDLACSGSFS